MSKGKTSKDLVPQGKAVEVIEAGEFSSVEVLDAFVEGDERNDVQAAYAEVKAKIEADEPHEEGSADVKDEAADAPTPPDESGTPPEEENETVEVEKASVKKLAESLKARLDADSYGISEEPDAIDQGAIEAQAKLETLAKAKGKTIEVAESELVAILIAIQAKANRDQERRGMMQPSETDKALMEAREQAEGLTN